MSTNLRLLRGNWTLLCAATLLIASFFLAATSGPIPLRGLIVQLAAIVAIVVAVLNWRGPRPSAPVLLALVAIPAVPLLQLIPLPPDIWQAMPGRQIATEIAILAGGSQWRPVSLDPNSTLRSLLALLPPIAMFLTAYQLRSSDHQVLIWAIIIIGLASTFIGAVQVLSGSDNFYLFWDANEGLPTGLFGNRNHQAVFLVLCALFCYYLIIMSRIAFRPYTIMLSCLIVLFSGAVFATGSRAGISLLLIITIFSPFFLSFNIDPKKILAGSLFVISISIFLFTRSNVVARSLDRFDDTYEDGRLNIWPDVLFAVNKYMPFGSGAGTFTQSFQPFESLNHVSRYYVPRAHNDYLELALEIGIIVFPLIIAVLGLIIYRAGHLILLSKSRDAWLGRTMVLGCLALALHSIVDYPVQTVALGSVLGMALGILFADQSAEAAQDSAEERDTGMKSDQGVRRSSFRHVTRGALLVCSAALALKVISVGVSDAAVQSGNHALAARAWPASVDAQAGWAEALLQSGQTRDALRIASQSLHLSSESSFALRTAARAAQAANLPQLADRTWAIAAKLGWRDGFVQDWVFGRAMEERDYLTAARAADAMARTDFQREIALNKLASLSSLAGGREAVAESMAARPPWTREFIAVLMRSPIPADALARFLHELDTRGAVPDDRSAFPILDRLLVRGESDLVVSIWRKRHPAIQGDPRKGLVDAEFKALDSDELIESFFGWQDPQDSRALVRRVQAGGGVAFASLRVETTTRVPIAILHQILALPPGSYRFEYALDLSQGSERDYYWEVQCNADAKSAKQILASNRREPVSGSGEWAGQSLAFVVPNSECAAQTLRLRGIGTLDEGSSANFANLRIVPASETQQDRP